MSNEFSVEEAQTLYEALRECYAQDRAFNGFPVCDLTVRTWTDADPISGTQGTVVDTVSHAGIDCDFAPYTVRQIASSGGLIQQEDIRVRFYDVGEIDVKVLVSLRGAMYRIKTQNYEPTSGRSELHCSPLTNEEG
jgi:hypothetical protein